MDKQSFSVELPKETHELGQFIYRLLFEIHKAQKEGFSAMNIPQIIVNSLQDLMKAIEGIDKLDDEFREDPIAASLAIAYPLAMGIKEMLKK